MRIEMTGKLFGYLTVMSEAGKDSCRQMKWLCRCRCGNEVVVSGVNLRNGHTKSCSCLQKEIVAETSRKHSGSRTKIYTVWQAMIQRCKNPNHPGFQRYGGRGISVCEEWESFETFRDWCLSNGYSANKSIDRTNNNMGYVPNNCRWVDMITQANNTCRNRRTMVDGEFLTLAQIARKYSMPYSRVSNRYYLGHRDKNLISNFHLNKAGAKTDE